MEHQHFMLTSAILACLLIFPAVADPKTRAYECLNIHVVYDRNFADYYKDNQGEFGLKAENPADEAIKAIHRQAQKFAYLKGLGTTLHLQLARITKTDLAYDGGDIKTFLSNAAIDGSETFEHEGPIDLYMVITNGITDNTVSKFVCDHTGLARSQFVGNPTTTYLGARRYLFNVAAMFEIYNGTSGSCDATARGVLEGMDASTICTDQAPLHWTTTSKDRYQDAVAKASGLDACYGTTCPKITKQNEVYYSYTKTMRKDVVPEKLCVNIRAIYDRRFVNYVAENKAKFGLGEHGSANDAIHEIFEQAQKYASLPGLGTQLRLHLERIVSTTSSYPNQWPAVGAATFMGQHSHSFGLRNNKIDLFVIFTAGLYNEQSEVKYCGDGYYRSSVILDPRDTYTAARRLLFEVVHPFSILPDLPYGCSNEQGGVMGDVDFLGVYSRTPPTKWSSCNKDQLAYFYKLLSECTVRPGYQFKCPPKPKTTKRPLTIFECQAKCEGECTGCHRDGGFGDYHCSFFPDRVCVERCLPSCRRG